MSMGGSSQITVSAVLVEDKVSTFSGLCTSSLTMVKVLRFGDTSDIGPRGVSSGQQTTWKVKIELLMDYQIRDDTNFSIPNLVTYFCTYI